MKKTLSKTITSILLCLSLVFSSIGFLPMSAFAGTDRNGINSAPINVTSIDIRLIDKKTERIKVCPTEINVGESFTFKAIFNTDAYANYKKVDWIVTGKDADGKDINIRLKNISNTTATFAPMQAGSYTITAIAKNESQSQKDWKTATVNITVLQPVTGIEIKNVPTDNKMDVDATCKLSTTLYPEDVSDDYQTVTWESNNTAVATVDEHGTVTAVAPGKATITAIARNESANLEDWKTGAVTITVLQPVTDIKIENTPDNDTMDAETSCTLKAILSPPNVSEDYKTVTWESDNPDVATVNQNGTVKAVARGQAKITATAKNGSTNPKDWKTANVAISVLQPVKTIKITNVPTDNKMYVGSPHTLTATLSPDNVSDVYQTVTWSSSDTAVATVDEKTGQVTPVAPGPAKITATAKNGLGDEQRNKWKTADLTITVVRPPADQVTLPNGNTSYVCVGHQCTLTAKVFPPAADQTVAWFCMTDVVAEVDEKTGTVTAINPGQVEITAIAKNGSTNQEDWKTATVDIIVVPLPVIALNKSVLALNSNDNEKLTAIVLPSESDPKLRWLSDNIEVATVDDSGIVKAVGQGQATITATTFSGHSAFCKVYVDMVVINHNDTPKDGPNPMTIRTIAFGPVKLTFNTDYCNNDEAWFRTDPDFKLKVEPADNSNITIKKCLFYSYYKNDTRETACVESPAPFEHAGWTGTGDDAGRHIITQVDVYFTRTLDGPVPI